LFISQEGSLERDWEVEKFQETWQDRLDRRWEARQEEASGRTLWDEYEGNWVEMMEFRIPPKSTDRMQMELDLGDVA
jgi:hypothetical protein